MSLASAQEVLLTGLRKLQPTGPNGFEGFMAGALSEFTSRSFHIVKSGHQEGSDMRSAPHGQVKIGLEAKRWKSSTSSKRGQLLQKITDASTAHTPVDLWLLAATCSIDASDREALDRHGASFGIGVLVLDGHESTTQISALAILCASAPDLVKSYLSSSGNLDNALELIRRHPKYETTREDLLFNLKRADLGYENARVASENWLTRAQSSLRNAKSLLGGHHDLGTSQDGVVSRKSINHSLDDWYQSGSRLGALVGDEGTGKSWAMLAWYNGQKTAQSGAPLTVFLKAKEVGSTDVREALAKALQAQTNIRTVEFWRKRLELWEGAGREAVEILVLLDGLNENFRFKEWASWLQPLFEDNLNKMYQVVISCWANWWRESLSGLRSLEPEPWKIEVSPFSEDELDEFLEMTGFARSAFPAAALDLMRTPRLCALAVEHRDRLNDIADITAERLIYEDWKDRLKRRGPIHGLNSDLEMRDFAADVGRKLKSDIDRRMLRSDVIASLSVKSGMISTELEQAVSEATSGFWLKPLSHPNTYKVSENLVPFVLALTLISEILDEADILAVPGRIAEFLDPLKSHSLGCDILCAASTVALLDEDATLEIRQIFLSTWLDQQNFQSSDFDAFWRLARLDPETFLVVGETAWLGGSTGFRMDEVLIKSFANAAEFQDFREALEQRLARWLGTAWPDPLAGTVTGPINPKSAGRAENTRLRHKQMSEDRASESFAAVALVESGGWSWLSSRAIAIISYLKRAPFAQAFEAWALSRSVMDCPRHIEEVAWILRLNVIDPAENDEAIEVVINRLVAQDNPICEQAATYLMRAKSNIHRSLETQPSPASTEEAQTPLDVTGMDAKSLFHNAQNLFSPYRWKQFAPSACAELTNKLVRKLADSLDEALDLALEQLGDLFILLSDDALDHFEHIVLAKLKASESDSEDPSRLQLKLEIAQFAFKLFRSPPARQSVLVLSKGLGTKPENWFPFLHPIKSADAEHVDLSAAPVERLVGWLKYLLAMVAKEDIAVLQCLPVLITHPDAEVRLHSLHLAVEGNHIPALRSYVNSVYSEDRPNGTGRLGSLHDLLHHLAILEICDYAPEASVQKWLSPEYIALIVENRPADTDALRKFSDFLRGEFESISTATRSSTSDYWGSHEEAIAKLSEHDLDALLSWLEPWIESAPTTLNLELWHSFPLIDAMRALREKAPKTALKLYDSLIDASRHSIISTGGISNFPIEVRNLDYSQLRRQELILEAKNDMSLLGIAASAFEHEERDWLFGEICRLEQSQKPTDVARAYTLLGFSDECAQADGLWTQFFSQFPVDPWLDDVITNSWESYSQNRQGRGALQEFWSSEDLGRAWQGLKQVLDVCDDRIYLWYKDVSPTWSDRPYRRRIAFHLAAKGIDESVKKDKNAKKKLLFHTPIGFSTKAPWN